MLIKHDDVRRIAHLAERELREVVERDLGLDDANMIEALKRARFRSNGHIPMITSPQYLELIAIEYIEEVH